VRSCYSSQSRLLIIIVLCSAAIVTYAQIQSNVRQVAFTFKYDVSIPGSTSKIRLVVALPKTLGGRQKILRTEISPAPTNIFEENGSRYAEFFVNTPPKHFTVEVNVNTEVYTYDLVTAQSNGSRNSGGEPDLSQYLQSEKFIETDDPMILQAAAGITGSDEFNIVESIYDYVINNMNYDGSTKYTLGAAAAIRGKTGDCSEYASLFVALCRAKGIPAKTAVGYVVPWTVSPKHAWAEVYFKEYGWVPFDPTYEFKENIKGRDTRFSHLNRIYLYATSGINDKQLRDSYSWVYYWGDKATTQEFVRIETGP
jgi:transglutaminase-like putative cysteine protease